MLGDEHRVISPRCLFPILGWKCRCQPAVDEVSSVLEDLTDPFLLKILQFPLSKMYLAAEGRAAEAGKDFLHISHGQTASFPKTNLHVGSSMIEPGRMLVPG